MIVVVPFRNAWPWIGACLASIAGQDGGHFQVVVVDDMSDDGYSDYVRNMCNVINGSLPSVRYIRNDTRLYMPHNLRVALDDVPGLPEQVVVIVDGDDWLPPGALQKLAKVYEDPDVWVTWGSYTRWPDPKFMPNPAMPVPPQVIDEGRIRQHPYEFFNHPLTFRRFLFDKVTDAELQDDKGQWLTISYDKALMYPMVELAGSKHSRYLSEVMYVYNESNPASDAKARPRDCTTYREMIVRRPPRVKLD